MTFPDEATGADGRFVTCAIVVFAAASLACAVSSNGFLTADALTHYLYAKYAFTDPTLLVDYSYGTVDTTATGGSLYNTVGSATGSMNVAKAVITITTPLSTVGSPAANSALTKSAGETLESIGTPAGGLLEAVDSAGPGTSYAVGKSC